MKEIVIGRKLYLQPSGNLARYYKNELKEGFIFSIKRKYFYVQFDDSNIIEKFSVENLKNINKDCNSEWIIWFSAEDYKQEKEKNKMIKEIYELVRDHRKHEIITYDSIVEVYEILEKYMD